MCVCVLKLCVFVWWNENKWDHYSGRGAVESGRKGNRVIILLFDDAESMLICFIQSQREQCQSGH